jgi:hypothetical protein
MTGVLVRRKAQRDGAMEAEIREMLKPEFWTPSPNSWASTCQAQPLASICNIKNHGEGQRKEVYYMPGQEAK